MCSESDLNILCGKDGDAKEHWLNDQVNSCQYY